MKKKYFVKYLPVEGEIKEEDWCKDPKAGDIFQARKWEKHASENYQKVKLFLCSRDIQVGDEIYFPKLNEYHKFLRTGNKQIYCQTLNGQHDEEFPIQDYFKVIGEISASADWVKEETEFEKEELAIKWDRGFVPLDHWFPEAIRKKGFIIAIRCSQCKHFH